MPPKGSQKLAVLLCKFRDSADVEPQPVGFFRDLFVTRIVASLEQKGR